ncbi:MAG: glycine cleavage system protein GcvH [Candidatus Omnitrophica bacterium]|nr:glycine cleavage system protein GcvH [Candidatus Omnitrophota bacterium]
MNIPEGLLYTKEHEWAKIEGSKVVVGISDYAQSSLGDITFVELPKVGDEVKQFKTLTTIESVKAASDVYAPLTGKVVKINEKIVNSPEVVNQSSYEDGWFVVLEIKDENEKKNLMNAADYKTYVEGLS